MGRRRAILTDTERELLQANENSERYYQAVSRVRRKINEELSEDIGILEENHPKLYSELSDIVCSKAVDPQWLREELEAKREQIESQFDHVVAKITRLDNGHMGIWVRINTSNEHLGMVSLVEDVSEYLHTRGYNSRAAYDGEPPDYVTDTVHEGHVYAQPTEIGEPSHPKQELRSGGRDTHTSEWVAE